MKEEVVGPREVFKSCFFVGLAAFIIFIVFSIGFFIWLYNFYDPIKP